MCCWMPRRTDGIAAAPAGQGEIPGYTELRCLSRSDALGLGIRLQRARRGCELLAKLCTGDGAGLLAVSELLPKQVRMWLLALLSTRWRGADPGFGMSRLQQVQSTAVPPGDAAEVSVLKVQG